MYHHMRTQVNNLNDPTHSLGDFINNGLDHGILGKKEKKSHLFWESLSLSVFSSHMCLYYYCRYLPPVQNESHQRATTMLWNLLLMARGTSQKTGGQDGNGRGKEDCKSQWGLVGGGHPAYPWVGTKPSPRLLFLSPVLIMCAGLTISVVRAIFKDDTFRKQCVVLTIWIV